MGKQICQDCGKIIPFRTAICPSCMLSLGFRTSSHASSSIESGEQIGRYRLIEQAGRGAFGTVWLAEQHEPVRRRVALKILNAGLDSDEITRRFEAERQALALMDHPHIAKVFDGGTTELGRPFFVMEFFPGTPITRFCDDQRLNISDRLELFLRVCDAVQHAHYKGVLHRDLKPGNILVAEHESGPVPKVIDFGVAKALAEPLTEETVFTRFQQFLGTPAYMSPEQAGLGSADIDTRSDIYSLGVLLCELLTGQTPFETMSASKRGTDQMLRAIREAELDRPSAGLTERSKNDLSKIAELRRIPSDKLCSTLRGDLDWIVLRALEKDRDRRYQTANALAQDIRRYLRHEEVEARAPSTVYRVGKFIHRNRLSVGAAAAVMLALSLGLVASLWQGARARKNAESVRRELYVAKLRLARDAWGEGNLAHAASLLEEAPEELREFQWRLLQNICRDESRATFSNAVSRTPAWTQGVVFPLGVSPDGSQIIAPRKDRLILIHPLTGTISNFVNFGTNTVRRYALAEKRPGIIAYETDQIYVRSQDGTFLLGGEGKRYSSSALALSPDGTLLVSASWDRKLHLLDVISGSRAAPEIHVGESSFITALRFSPDAKYLLAATDKAAILVITVKPFAILKEVRGHAAFVQSFRFDSEGTRVASCANDGRIRVWSFPDTRELAELTGHSGKVADVAFSPDGRSVASAGLDSTVRVWNLARPTDAVLLRGHSGPVSSVIFSPDGKELYSGSDDETVKVWSTPSDHSTNVLRHSRWVNDIAFSPDGKFLAAEDYHAQRTVIWEVPKRQQITNLIHSSGYLGGHVRFSPDGRYLAAAGQDESAEVWDVPDFAERVIIRVDSRGGTSPIFLAFHPKKPILAMGKTRVQFWNLEEGREIQLLEEPHDRGVANLEFSGNGQFFAAGDFEGGITVWDLVTGRQIDSFRAHGKAEIGRMAFSHDNRFIASGGSDNTIAIYDLRMHRTIANLAGHTGQIPCVAYSPDGQSLLSASYDGTVRFWYLANHRPGLTLRHSSGGVSAIVFSPDGNLMATSGGDGTVRLWPAHPKSLRGTP